MFGKIINKLFANTLSSQRRKILALEKENNNLRSLVGDPRFVVTKVLDKGIEWFSDKDMSKESRRRYYAEAQQILGSSVFNNLINYLIATQCQEQVKQYNPELHLNPIRDTQMMINAWELLREELDAITDPDKDPKINVKEFDPYALT